jgi:hypothetical protein
MKSTPHFLLLLTKRPGPSIFNKIKRTIKMGVQKLGGEEGCSSNFEATKAIKIYDSNLTLTLTLLLGDSPAGLPTQRASQREVELCLR